ncbi:hypothetical protein Scep_019065 [Stephania cephalantha]|uniref:NAC domain-containing protein n=1 Tax=Stephania cephalantha TaxID=152367 RepID=A0AAP0IA03_9MAGN
MKDCDLPLPPGFRFHPTDEELVMHYLCRKCASLSISVPIVAEIDLYKHDPWLLPGMASYGEKEWYFFSPRDRKYPNGSRPNRAAGSGYWKATGADKPIGTPKPVGIKKALVFYTGKAPRGLKTNWIMHEYRLADVDRSARKKNSRLDDWVLCRIYNKKGGGAGADKKLNHQLMELNSRNIYNQQQLSNRNTNSIGTKNDYSYLETSESIPKSQWHAESSGSEYVMSSKEVNCEREVQSEPKWVSDWERALDVQVNNGNAIELSNQQAQAQHGQLGLFQGPFVDYGNPLQDIFMYLQKPF